jgi:hypothetical protein
VVDRVVPRCGFPMPGRAIVNVRPAQVTRWVRVGDRGRHGVDDALGSAPTRHHHRRNRPRPDAQGCSAGREHPVAGLDEGGSGRYPAGRKGTTGDRSPGSPPPGSVGDWAVGWPPPIPTAWPALAAVAPNDEALLDGLPDRMACRPRRPLVRSLQSLASGISLL